MNQQTLEQMKHIDLRTVDRDALRDIESIHIDRSFPKKQRIADFIRQIGNPYCYKHGKYVVKISFTDTDITLEDRLASYITQKATSSTGTG